MMQSNKYDPEVIITNAEDQEVMNIGEVAEYLRVGKTLVYEMLKNGELPGFKLGNAWHVSKEACNIYIRHRSGLI